MEIDTLHKADRTPVLGRANSRTRGISIKTVTPSHHMELGSPASGAAKGISACPSSLASPCSTSSDSSVFPGTPTEFKAFHSRRSSVSTRRDSAPAEKTPRREFRSQSFSGSHYDFALPPPADLSQMDINEQLRLLALKEMSVVEMRDTISTMKSKLHDSECDLSNLRQLIQKSLYRELNLQHQATRTRTEPNDARRPLKPSNKPHDRLKPSEHKTERVRADDRQSKLWSNLSKPITFIQSLDTMLLNEFEKSLVGDAKQPVRKDPRRTRLQRSQESKQANLLDQLTGPANQPAEQANHLTDPNQNEQNQKSDQNPTQPIGRLSESTEKNETDDMFYAVSNSLWAFVNEVKSNVISTINENAEYVLPPKSPPPTENPDETISLSPLDCDEDQQDYKSDEDSIDFSMYASMRRKK